MMDVAARGGEQGPHCSLRSGGGPQPDTFIDPCSTHLSQRQATFLISTSRFTLDRFGNHFIGKLTKRHLSKRVQFACKITFIWPAKASGTHSLNAGYTAPQVSKGLFLGLPCWDLNYSVQSWCNACRHTSVIAFMALQEYAPTLAWKQRILSHRNYLSGTYAWSKLMRFVCCASRSPLSYECGSSSLATGGSYHFMQTLIICWKKRSKVEKKCHSPSNASSRWNTTSFGLCFFHYPALQTPVFKKVKNYKVILTSTTFKLVRCFSIELVLLNC